MENLTLKVRISVLWLFYAGALSAMMTLMLIEPGVIEGVVRGELPGGFQVTEGLLVFSALCWLITLIMAFLTLVLRDTANRWANLVLGVLFAVLGIYAVVGHISRGELNLAHIGHILLDVSTIVVSALIAWYAWKWPTQEA